MDWLNPWVVTIGAGVAVLAVGKLGSLIANKFIWSKRDEREQRQRVDVANNEVLYALRPFVAQNTAPKKEVIESLVRATARKHALRRQDLLSLSELTDSLIKEVMDSSFLSTEQKSAHCDEIAKLKDETSEAKPATSAHRGGSTDPYYIYKQKTRKQLTWVLNASMATAVAITVGAMSLMINKMARSGIAVEPASIAVLITTFATIAGVVPIAASLFSDVFKRPK